MFVSALLKEIKQSGIYVEIYKKRKKYPQIVDRNTKNNYQIFVIFGINISDTTGYETTV